MTQQFDAFANDTQGLTLTDTHGNEFTVQNDPEQIAIYGQWQGPVSAPEVQALTDVFTSISSKLSSFKSEADSQGIHISKKKNELDINVDIEVTKDAKGLAKVEGFLQALKVASAKLTPTKP